MSRENPNLYKFLLHKNYDYDKISYSDNIGKDFSKMETEKDEKILKDNDDIVENENAHADNDGHAESSLADDSPPRSPDEKEY